MTPGAYFLHVLPKLFIIPGGHNSGCHLPGTMTSRVQHTRPSQQLRAVSHVSPHRCPQTQSLRPQAAYSALVRTACGPAALGPCVATCCVRPRTYLQGDLEVLLPSSELRRAREAYSCHMCTLRHKHRSTIPRTPRAGQETAITPPQCPLQARHPGTFPAVLWATENRS